MIRLFQYLALRRRNPNKRDFIARGCGIEARARRCRRYWRRHIELTKSEQIALCGTFPPGGSVLVLGAGRLYDIAVPELAQSFEEIELWDADPGVLRVWRRLRRELPGVIKWKICDVSATIDRWTEALRLFFAATPPQLEKLCDFLDRLDAPLPDFGNHAAVLSVNLLSQIPLYWRDRLESALADAWGISPGEEGLFEQPLRQALERTMGLLQQQHLAALAASGAEVVLLIADTAFFCYRKDSANWQEEQALYDCSLDLPAYSLIKRNSWLWHIAPQGIEQRDCGIIHRVESRLYGRSV